MMLGYAMAADSDKTLRRKLSLQPPNIATPEAGAFVSLSQLKYKHSSNEDAEYGSTLEYAVGYGDSVRNSYGKGSKKGSTVGTKKAKKAKIPSISSQYGKDCPKKNKSKDGAKGSKKSAAPTTTAMPTGSGAPSFAPSISNEPSQSIAPSDSPSESFKPSGWWCQGTDEPTVTAAPTESFEPSFTPSISNEPSISNNPSASSAPSSEPSYSSAPSGAPNGGARSEIIEEASCSLYTATFEDGAAVLCNPTESQCPAADATAAVTTEVESNQDLEDALGYNVDVTFEVNAPSPSPDTIADGLDETLSKPVVLTLVGCAGKARNVALEHYRTNANAGRRLQDGTLALMNNWGCGKFIPCLRVCRVGFEIWICNSRWIVSYCNSSFSQVVYETAKSPAELVVFTKELCPNPSWRNDFECSSRNTLP